MSSWKTAVTVKQEWEEERGWKRSEYDQRIYKWEREEGGGVEQEGGRSNG